MCIPSNHYLMSGKRNCFVNLDSLINISQKRRSMELSKVSNNSKQVSSGKAINVAYTLNQKKAYAKKASACDRELYKIEALSQSCKISFSCAVFETFRGKLHSYFEKNNEFSLVHRHVLDEVQK